MTPKFNKNDVLRFLYDEMGPAEQEAFLDALCTDEELWSTYEELKETKEAIEPDEEILEPSGRSVQTVLNYVRHSVPFSPVPAGASGQRSLPLHIVLSVIMIICTTLTIAAGVYAYNRSPQESIYTEETTQLRWEDEHLDRRIQRVKMNLQNLSGQRQTILPLYNNTYRLVNTADFAPQPQNVVLVNIR